MTSEAPLGNAASRTETRPGLVQATAAALARRSRGGPPWLEALRAEAAARLEAAGFPKHDDEAFRFTPLGAVMSRPYAPRIAGATSRARVFPNPGGIEVIVADGRPHLNAPLEQGGVQVRRIGEVLEREPGLLEPYLGRLAGSQTGFEAQNTALFEDGVVVIARRGSHGAVVHLSFAGEGTEPTLGTPRTLIIAEPESDFFLLESHAGSGQYLESGVTEIFLGAGSALEHVRVQLDSPEAAEGGSALSSIAVRQCKDSRYRSRIFTLGGALTRVDLRALLEEPGAECSLDGLYVARSGALFDHHTRIVHASPHCTSRERYKGIADGNGVAVFDGTIVVNRGASGTEAHQENRNLLLSDDAVIHAKPHLEIDTDDVRCSHGATIGRLDPAQLFYLRSRGIDAEVARSLLTYAFAREMVTAVSHKDVASALEEAIALRLPSGARARELA